MNEKMAKLISGLGVKTLNESICTGRQWVTPLGSEVVGVYTPVDGSKIADVVLATETEYEHVIRVATSAFMHWRAVPAPQRGDIIRRFGNRLRIRKRELGALVSYEMGKSLQEGLGEVQEMIDICDFAVGLSRQLYGLTIQSERPNHRMMEQWHPLGIVGVISAFNFPVAVWAWNAMIAAVCGDVVIWKPSEKAPLSAIACHEILKEILIDNDLPEGIFNLIMGDSRIGEMMAKDSRIPLISATGSTGMGRRVGQLVGNRLGRAILELGGNNALIISNKANLENAVRAVVFGAIGTAGQRCTSTRRVIVHEEIYDHFRNRLTRVYEQLRIGDPLDEHNQMGPLIDRHAVEQFKDALHRAEDEGGRILFGGETLEGPDHPGGCYVKPAIVEAMNHYSIVQQETFAPILYLMKYKNLDEAIAMQNDVPQGLSSAIFTDDLLEAEQFLAGAGSDCGIANVNIGTSGAEIGGAFGGEKETGGGRESGSDAWKGYMRRQTNTINYGREMPLAQGIRFDL
ncbi:MAG: aldehyde dehydrogenase family protein [Flavobacteriales bacterium]|nr:aldehyde dehydrogenase family protein [Flavobacteriales bacterium]